jgi:hypothetical protein
MPEGASLDLHEEGVRACAEARGSCSGWLVDIAQRKSKRRGLWLLDVLRFRRVHDVGGFDFTGVLLVMDDRVVHKLWSAVPSRRVVSTRVRPLGLLQGDTHAVVDNPLELPLFTTRVRAGAARAAEPEEPPADGRSRP